MCCSHHFFYNPGPCEGELPQASWGSVSHGYPERPWQGRPAGGPPNRLLLFYSNGSDIRAVSKAQNQGRELPPTPNPPAHGAGIPPLRDRKLCSLHLLSGGPGAEGWKAHRVQLAPWRGGGVRETKGTQSSSEPLLQPPEDPPFPASRRGDPHWASVVITEMLGSCVDPSVSSVGSIPRWADRRDPVGARPLRTPADSASDFVMLSV